ncbi:serine/threonine protein kinase (plasmid) [Mycobacterium kubicae]|nr:serine/threonine protein kinase [Mycobacterium kubicae]QNI09713.1 serine/threonine protein kinase [Mycobacterium kubicae]QNI15280.1 serine/threonine protein kinase [Mycobacterium kubicae]
MRLGGMTEVAQLLGVSTQRAAALRDRPDFPDPVGEIAQGPIWDLDVVAGWNGSGLRQTKAGRPKAEVATRTLGGRFLLETPAVGSGGFADVFRATDRKTGELVAVKVLRDTASVEPEAIARFKRELKLLEGLRHPNVISVLAHGETDDDEVWYAMPLAQGSLADFVAKVDGNPAMIVDIMRQIGEGLRYIHTNGVLHRDLKPANVLRLESGEWAVSDFGLAVHTERGTTPLTSTLRAGMGSWVYAAPEQWANARSADRRSDIYSLGKTLQQLVTGEFPVNTEIPASPLRPVIERAIANKPTQRYESVDEFLEALQRALDAHEEYRSVESREQTAERLRDRMLSPSTTPADLAEMLEWAATLDESNHDDMQALSRVLPWCGAPSIKFLWDNDRGTFQRVFQRFIDHVASSSFSFEYCDVLANFVRRAVSTTADSNVLRQSVRALAELGPRHNRWHVRDVLVSILQDTKNDEMALAAVEGLRAVNRTDVNWSITDFTVRTLPPTIRAGIDSWRTRAG